MHHDHAHAPTRANLKAWWNSFTFAQRAKKETEAAAAAGKEAEPIHTVFGKPLKESLKYANVQISTANANGELYVWGYIPVVVAKCGLYLKENATEVEGTFRVNGSAKRMRELQAKFENPPRYGKSLDWKKETYTTHDCASVFRRYLTQMPEPVIPHDLYHEFRDALAKQPYNQDEVIATYKSLIRRMPRANQYLLLYVLDLLSVFARKSDKNLMTAKNLAVIFRPGLISHPNHEMSPQEHHLSQQVLEFLIAHQDWFMLDIPPPPTPSEPSSPAPGSSSAPSSGFRDSGGGTAGGGGGGAAGGAAGAGGAQTGGIAPSDEDIIVVPSSDEETPTPSGSSAGLGGGWKLVHRADSAARRIVRRRTVASPPRSPVGGAHDSSRLRPGELRRTPSSGPRRDLKHGGVLEEGHLSDEGLSPVAESPQGRGLSASISSTLGSPSGSGAADPVSPALATAGHVGVNGSSSGANESSSSTSSSGGGRGWSVSGALGVKRSRTLPTGRRNREEGNGGASGSGGGERERARVLRKQKRASSSQGRAPPAEGR
ncbi:hypothetical protein HGRIS_004444 [Hohenbuehelia grisea]|uniref:Rho-GAP domain-containing protein n=1 Tax=Hohenbuehelia grisea TaxID=104357 RepID=A0ABR3JCH8_9AGAR